MEKATEIFEKHWTKATGKPLDETTKHHMKYAIEAINEALLLGAVSGQSGQLANFCTCKKTWGVGGRCVACEMPIKIG